MFVCLTSARCNFSICVLLWSFCYSQENATPLHCAAKNGHKAVLQLLRDHGALVLVETSGGHKASCLASKNSHNDCAALLEAWEQEKVRVLRQWNASYEN
jgi:hypothetical protein